MKTAPTGHQSSSQQRHRGPCRLRTFILWHIKILGFEQLFIKCHGRSSARAIGNAVKVAAKAVRDHVPREIADALAAAR